MNVVVIGAPRSGTTLLAGLISSSDSAYPMLPECTYVTQLIRLYHETLAYSDPQRFSAFAVDEGTLRRTISAATSEFLITAKGHFSDMPERHLVLKDPELTLMTDLVPSFFGSDAKIVCIVRDPRAVIALMLVVSKKKRTSAWKNFRTGVNWNNAAALAASFLRYADFFPIPITITGGHSSLTFEPRVVCMSFSSRRLFSVTRRSSRRWMHFLDSPVVVKVSARPILALTRRTRRIRESTDRPSKCPRRTRGMGSVGGALGSFKKCLVATTQSLTGGDDQR